MGQISVLDDNMINMIAAGEVIERPASIVKELMENSIDAGATKIIVAIEQGGRSLISISDDGAGMDAEDLEQAFEPHATSKIKTSGDLRSIATLGFRGEALASIASVSAVKAISRLRDTDQGNMLEIDCGDKKATRPCSADYGTTIAVRDIFYKLPARRKFLKTVNTEFGHVTEQFIRIALANTNLDLTLSHNGREIYHLSAGQSLRSRIAELFSTEIAESLTEISFDEKNMQMFALLGRPDVSRANNKLQYTFLNSRFIRDKFISHAVKEAYRSYIEAGRFPAVFLFIKMPCEDFDVNVHPTKTEVRFYNSNLVHSQILGAIREKLLAGPQDIRAKLSGRAFQSQPAEKNERSEKINQAMADFFKKHRPQSQPQLGFSHSGTAIASASTEKRYTRQVVPLSPQVAGGHKYLQLHDSYIVTETEDGFVIIDQHAMHERLLYNDLKKRISVGKLESQKLLIPESFQITATQQQVLEGHRDIFDKMGIELAPFGPKTSAIHSFPTLLAKAEPVGFVRDLLDLLADSDKALDAQTLLDEVINMAACKAAIKAGQRLTDHEIEQLLTAGLTAELSGRCPHGRPTTIKFSITELEKQFKRT